MPDLMAVLGDDKEQFPNGPDTTNHNPVEVFSKCVGRWEVNPEQFNFVKKIGEGAMGVIYKATLNGKDVAAKKLKDRNRENNLQAYKDLVMELDILVSIGRHPNLVEFKGACLVDRENPVIFEEFVTGPSLEEYFSKKIDSGYSYRPPRSVVYAWIMDMMRALEFLHNRDPIIIHRDMKPGNLLLTKDLTTLKLADFGMGKIIAKEMMETVNHTGYTGTVRYMAPEVFSCNKGHYTEKADIYSAAIIMWFVATGQRPLIHGKQDLVWRPELAPVEWPELRDVMGKAWAGDPNLRPSASEVVKMMARLPGKPPPVQPSDFKSPGCGCCVQ